MCLCYISPSENGSKVLFHSRTLFIALCLQMRMLFQKVYERTKRMKWQRVLLIDSLWLWIERVGKLERLL